MWILGQPGGGVVDEPGELVLPGRRTLADLPFPLEIGPDRFAVPADMPGDRRDRPPSFP